MAISPSAAGGSPHPETNITPALPTPSAKTPLPHAQPLFTPSTSLSSARSPPAAPNNQTLDGTRFVPNKVERAWLLYNFIALNAPIQKLKTLEETYKVVAYNARVRHISDSEILAEQQRYGMSWRRTYMNRIRPVNVVYISSTVAKISKSVPVAASTDQDIGPIAAVRAGCTERGLQQLLDQAVLDYKTEAANKKRKAKQKARREREIHAKEVQSVKALTLTANAAAASTQLHRRQSEQIDVFLAVYAERHNLTPCETPTPIPAELTTTSIDISPCLTAPVQTTTSAESASLENNTGTRTSSVEAGEIRTSTNEIIEE